MDAIIVDDPSENSNQVIDLDADNSDDVIEITNIKNSGKIGMYDNILEENKLIGQVIDKCLNLEHSDGMIRVINRSLIPTFERTCTEYRNSNAFKKVVTTALGNLEKLPHFKFSHVKELCMNLKLNNKKYRKNAANVHNAVCAVNKKGKKRKRKRIETKTKIQKCDKNRAEIVLSDDSDGFEVPVINLEESTKEVPSIKNKQDINFDKSYSDIIDLITQPQENANNEPIELVETDSEKENNAENVRKSSDPRKAEKLTVDLDEKMQDDIPAVCISDEEIMEVIDDVKEAKYQETELNDVDKFLVPLKEEVYSQNEEQIALRIKQIESDITKYKDVVAKLEEQEVVDDSLFSPYIMCENYKAKIVNLYHQLCELTGDNPVKRRKVRLTPAEKRLSLPMKNLEEFINSRIGADGVPHFPDFCDVVQCVKNANRSGNLGWKKNEIMNNARALFTHCGRALQKNRQRREWRDMLRLVRSELVEDPADADPELMARLNANRRHAVVRETEMFQRWADRHEPALEDSGHINPQITETSHRDSTNIVKITPVSVPFNYNTHSISRIVNRKNQIVEIVVSNDAILNNATNVHENSNMSEAFEDSTINTDKTIPECTVSNGGSTQDTQDRAGSNYVTTKQEPKESNDGENNVSSSTETCSIVNEYNRTLDNGTESLIYGVKQESEEYNYCEVTSSNGAIANVNYLNDSSNIIPEAQIPEKTEPLVGISVEDQCNGEETNNNTVLLNHICHDNLAHILNAKVVLPRLSIKYENVNHSENVNNPPDSNDTTHDCGNVTRVEDEKQNVEPEIKIKCEPSIDIQGELDEFGDNFTITVFDIQDPFLVVEISSDSNSEDENDDV